MPSGWATRTGKLNSLFSLGAHAHLSIYKETIIQNSYEALHVGKGVI
jgi:hypothetical protein